MRDAIVKIHTATCIAIACAAGAVVLALTNPAFAGEWPLIGCVAFTFFGAGMCAGMDYANARADFFTTTEEE